MKTRFFNVTAIIVFFWGCMFSCSKKGDIFQDCDIDKRLTREKGAYFLVENGKRYPVDKNVITVKLKPGEEIGKEIEVIRSNSLGFIDIQVPEGIDVVDYSCMLKKTGKFELVELNAFGFFESE